MEHEARYLINTAKAIGVGNKTKIREIVMKVPQIDTRLPGSELLHYKEDLGYHHMQTLKRFDPRNGTWVKWNQNLIIARHERLRQLLEPIEPDPEPVEPAIESAVRPAEETL
jgi:hypothetical protein